MVSHTVPKVFSFSSSFWELVWYKYVSLSIYLDHFIYLRFYFSTEDNLNEMMLMMTANKRKCPQESVWAIWECKRTKQTASHKLIGNVALLYPLKYTKVSDVILSPSPCCCGRNRRHHTAEQKKKTKCHQRSHFLPPFVLLCITYSLWFAWNVLTTKQPNTRKRRRKKHTNRKRCC